MKFSLKIFIILLASTLIFTQSKAQEGWKSLYSFPLDNISGVSSDSYGNLYAFNEKGLIFKYDEKGQKLQTFSPSRNHKISLIQGSRNVNIFVFYEDYQEYLVLSRFLTRISSSRISSNSIGYAKIATLASDNNLWVLDENDFSLKKINLKFNRLEVNSPLQSVLPLSDYNFSYINEYNTNLYLSDSNAGILVFDNLGNYKTKIPGKNINYFSFYENYLYFLSNESLVLIDLLTGKERIMEIPEKKAKFVILHKEKIFFIYSGKAAVYQNPLPLKTSDF